MLQQGESQYERQLLGGRDRVAKDWKEERDNESGLGGVLVRVNTYKEDFFKIFF